MDPRHIYDVDGYWVAFVVGTEVFLRGGENGWAGCPAKTKSVTTTDSFGAAWTMKTGC